ncbi:MAG TPA: PKD domain-containing protein [Candidatus Thermoplasmatota archaeon]|nr:PKD domain-containing protein [Candidatus Thermoplasmatota archaeon]
MRPLGTLLIATTMALVGLSGCFGGDDPLKAAFVALPADEQKSQYKFDASTSTGEGLVFVWDFGDRTEPATGKLVEHKYDYLNGKYTVTLTVTDSTKKKSTMTQQVQVGSAPNNAPVLYLNADRRLVTPGELVTFDGSASYDADNDPLFFQWDFNTMLPDDDLNKMENLGFQQYGRYSKGPPPGSDNSTGGEGEPSGGEGGQGEAPSGRDGSIDVQKTVQRVLEDHGVTTLDGDHSAPPAEPRNEGFDGKINDTSPIQPFTFPSPATYFVHVKVFDVKGESAEGFIRIRVADTVPNATDTYVNDKDRTYAPEPVGNQNNNDVAAYRYFPYNQKYPGMVTITLTYAVEPAGSPLPTSMGAWACTSVATTPDDCKGQKHGIEAGPSPRTFTFEVRADLAGEAGAWKLLVSNEDNGSTKGTAVLSVVNDLNPWAKQEAGLEVGHH